MTTTTGVRRAVVVTRRSELELLLDTHGTRGQVEFFLASRGRTLEEVDAHHDAREDALRTVLTTIPVEWRRATVERDDLDRFLFEPDDILMIVGPDGLVANVAKYLDGQPVLGFDPHPGHNPGVLVRHRADSLPALLAGVASGRATVEQRPLVAAHLDDGRTLTALNEVFIGHRTHQSARYTLTCDGGTERQSSSGLIVATGTGATGWAASINAQLSEPITLPDPTERALAFFVREAWPSPATGTTLTCGLLHADEDITVRSEMDDGTIFGDGIERDPIPFRWGHRVRVGLSDKHLQLVV